MNYFEDSANKSPLSGFWRFVLTVMYWPIVGAAALSLVMSHINDEGTLEFGFSVTVIVAVAAYGTVWMWRFMVGRKARAKLGIGVMAVFYALVGLGLVSFDGCGTSGESGDDESHLSYGVASATADDDERSGFSVCVEELHRQPEGERSMRREAFDVLKGTVSPGLAEDAVQDVIIAVCETFEEGRVELLRPYFFKSVNNQKRDLRKVNNRYQYCQVDESTLPPVEPRPELVDEIRLLQAAMCRLEERKAFAIREKADGYSHREIAEKLDIDVQHSRRLVSDGRKELRVLMNELREP